MIGTRNIYRWYVGGCVVWSMEYGEWRMEYGEWRMENGEWRMENREWRMDLHHPPFIREGGVTEKIASCEL